ncbi:MAG: hypothetical protein ACR2RF_11885 [Geminicoccaceae bacterium]
MIGLTRLSPTAAAGLIIILFFGALAIFTDVLMPHDPGSAYPERVLQPPSATHCLAPTAMAWTPFPGSSTALNSASASPFQPLSSAL